CLVHLYQLFGDLDGVGGSAFADLIAGYEDFDAAAVFAGLILADASNQHIILAGGEDGHGEGAGFGIVHNFDARGLFEDGTHFSGGHGVGELDVDALAVGAGDGDAHAGGRDQDLGIGEDLAGFVDHLLLFFVVAVFADGGVVAEEVVDD